VTEGGRRPFDVGRAAQNMMLAAWNDGVVSCPNGMPDPAATADALGLEGDLSPLIVISFGYPRRDSAPESRSADDWSAEANRLPLDEVVVRRR
jgi:nitroreductase